MDSVETVIVNLKVLSSLQPYQKLNTKSKHFTITVARYIPEFVLRWYFSSSRDSDYNRITDLYSSAFDILRDNPHISQDLENSLNGLANLKKTYEPDVTFAARMDYLTDSVLQRLQNNEID